MAAMFYAGFTAQEIRGFSHCASQVEKAGEAFESMTRDIAVPVLQKKLKAAELNRAKKQRRV